MIELLDPTLIFMCTCLFSVIFIRGDPATMTLSLIPDIPGTLLGYVTDRAFPIGATVTLLAALLTRGTPTKGARAGWFLGNGVICHVMMDGLAGGHWGLKLMDQNYRQLDNRFVPRCACMPGVCPVQFGERGVGWPGSMGVCAWSVCTVGAGGSGCLAVRAWYVSVPLSLFPSVPLSLCLFCVSACEH